MKKTIVILVATLSIGFVKAQGLSNFFSQKQADIKYMLAQIAELQTYIGLLQKGYGIAQKGLTVIGDLKKGEFDLHSAFFSSLETVNPSIAKYAKVAGIISNQVSIMSSFKKILQLKNMSASEMSYLQSVYNNMSGACAESLTDLINIITDNTYQMKDNERITRIDAIYADMKDKYAFTQSFASDASVLSAQRGNDLHEIEFLKNLN
ncbi:MAG: hypothetical protein JST47_13160 [Bacteroidetes bacterium]|nr:hypothetical protein [Bacteroidota bacterium]MBS1973401.1 hypothetical protein [Bacteroidota bacterium]